MKGSSRFKTSYKFKKEQLFLFFFVVRKKYRLQYCTLYYVQYNICTLRERLTRKPNTTESIRSAARKDRKK